MNSRAAPRVLHLDPAKLQEEPLKVPLSSSGAPVQTGPSSSSQESQQPWSLFTALVNDIQNIRAQDGLATEGETSSNSNASTEVNWSSTSEDFTFDENRGRTELESSDLPLPVQLGTVSHPVTEGAHTQMTADPRQTEHTIKTSDLHRKHRSLLHKRQLSGTSGKSMHPLFTKF